jgi:hypothetical protein
MKIKPIAIFGNVGFLCQAEPNETRTVSLGSDGLVTYGLYYIVKGRAINYIVETGEVIGDRYAGWLSLEHQDAGASSAGTLVSTYVEETEWVCIHRNRNPRGLADYSSLIVEAGETISLANNSNIFLVKGQLRIDDQYYIGPRQIRIRTGDVQVEVVEKIYALKVS